MKYLDLISEKCGLNGQLFKFEVSDRNVALIKDLGSPSNMQDFLIYRLFDETTGLYLNHENHQGFVLEIEPIVGFNESIEKNLEHFLSEDLPAQTYMQFLLLASHKVGPILDLWTKGRRSDSKILTKIAEKRIEFIKAKALNDDKLTARNFRIIISVTNKEKNPAKLLKFKNILIRKLDSLSLFPREIKPAELLNLACELLKRDDDINQKPQNYNNYEPLNKQLLRDGDFFNVTEKEVICDKFSSRNYRISEFPIKFSMLGMLNLLGEVSDSRIPLIGRLALSFTIANDLNDGEIAKIISRGENVKKSSEQSYARDKLSFRREASEWVHILDLIKNGKKLLRYSFNIMLSCKQAFIDEAEANLISLYNLSDFRIKRADKLHLIAMLSILPMQAAYYYGALNFFKFTRLGISNECLAMIPLQGEWKGMYSPGMLFFARRGQLFNWNPFKSNQNTNYNVCVMGPTGGGKSVLLQEFVQVMIAQNTKVFVIDIGRSYKNLCLAKDGEFIEFTREANVSLNPFGTSLKELTLEMKEDLILYSKSIVNSICQTNGDALKESIIQKSIAKCLDKYGAETNLTKIAKELENDSSEGITLSRIMYPYTEGVYSKFFNAKTNIFFNKDLTVFELDDLKDDEHLLGVILQVVAMQILKQVFLGDRSRPKVIVFEEAWKYLPIADAMIAGLNRTVRKYYTSVVVCVQGYNDFQSTEHRKAIFQNAAWKIILKQQDDSLEGFKANDAFADILPLIRSISFEKGKYSECLIYGTGVTVIGRTVLDPYSLSLYSTTPGDYTALNNLVATGKSIDEAVDILVASKGSFNG